MKYPINWFWGVGSALMMWLSCSRRTRSSSRYLVTRMIINLWIWIRSSPSENWREKSTTSRYYIVKLRYARLVSCSTPWSPRSSITPSRRTSKVSYSSHKKIVKSWDSLPNLGARKSDYQIYKSMKSIKESRMDDEDAIIEKIEIDPPK